MSVFANLPTDLILKIVREADGGKSTHKLRLDKCLKQIKDIYWEYPEPSINDMEMGMMADIWSGILKTAYPIGCDGFCERYGEDMYSLNIHQPNPDKGETMEDFNRAVRWADYIQGWQSSDKVYPSYPHGYIPNYDICSDRIDDW
jgi:hypothetical protein